MAVAVQLDFVGMTLDQYDEILGMMGLTPTGPGAPGGISHFVTKSEDGVRIVDVWETKEHFERFAQEQIAPYAEKAGVPNPPSVQFFEVHNYLTPGQ